MTHARSNPARSNRARSLGRQAAPRPPFARSAAALAAPAPRPDPDSLADHRRLADALECPADCDHDSCRRAGRCRGPREAPTVFPGEAMPVCLAEIFDELYAPVARWYDLLDMVAAAEAELAAAGSGHDRVGRGKPANRSTR
jgi:hypothetical protein